MTYLIPTRIIDLLIERASTAEKDGDKESAEKYLKWAEVAEKNRATYLKENPNTQETE